MLGPCAQEEEEEEEKERGSGGRGKEMKVEVEEAQSYFRLGSSADIAHEPHAVWLDKCFT